ncbi:Uncharacterised protein [Halioglobus japonicus]|nr:Uncharacterised protein [Halioglobus japonicus]
MYYDPLVCNLESAFVLVLNPVLVTGLQPAKPWNI